MNHAHEKAGLVADPAKHQSFFISRLFGCQGRFRQVHPFRGPIFAFGGAGGTRTPDIRLAKAALSQLSYGPTAIPVWWAMVDSNHRPRSYQDRALTG